MDFSMEYEVGVDSVIELYLAQSMQIEFQSSQTMACYDNLAGKDIECTISKDSLLFPSFCKAGCTAGQKFSVKITKGLKNVNYVMS